MISYKYICQDDSILLPFFKKKVFSVLHRLIPYGVPANYLTLVSIFVVWSCFAFFILIDEPNDIDILLAIFAISVYVIFDHFDGLQAKLTSTGSPLGEILDHFSDVFNGSIIIYIFFRILQIELGWLFCLSLWFNLIAFSVTYYEQCMLKKLYFGKIGSLEGVIFILIIFCSLITNFGKIFWKSYSILGYPVHIFLIILLMLGVIYTVFSSLKRLKHFPRTFLHFILTGSILCYFCINNEIIWYLNFLVINVYSAEFILKSMKSHLMKLDLPRPDLMIYIFFFFIFFESVFGFEKEMIFLSYGVIIIFKIIWGLIEVFLEFKAYWIWWNSR